MRKNSSSGFTLVEVGIASSLLVLIVGVALLVMDYSQRFAVKGTELTHFHYRVQKMVQDLTGPLRTGNPRRAYDLNGTAYSWAVFPVPAAGQEIVGIEYARLDERTDGPLKERPPIDDEGNIRWTNDSFYLRFAQDGANIVNEALVGKDLNQNGTYNDVFRLGYLEQARGAQNDYAGVTWQRISNLMVLYLDADPTVSPMFTVAGDAANATAQRIDMRLWFYDPVNQVTIRIADSVAMINVQ